MNGNGTCMVTPEALRALVGRLRERSADLRIDLLVLATLVVTGCRASELLRLTCADIDGEQSLVRLTSEQGGSRWWPVPDYLSRELAYQAATQEAERLSDRLFVARDRTGSVRPITYARLRRMLAGYPRQGEAPQPVLAVAQLRARTIALLAAHPGARIATAFGHADPVSTLTRVGRNLGLALAIVEVFGGDHPWLVELPDRRD